MIEERPKHRNIAVSLVKMDGGKKLFVGQANMELEILLLSSTTFGRVAIQCFDQNDAFKKI